MDCFVEIISIDTRYERCRMRHAPSEERLLRSILAEGIRDPLLGTIQDGRHVVLDGFKRLRCAGKLAIHQVPFRSIGDDEAQGIISLMRRANAQNLSILEQAYLVTDLREVHGLSVREISLRLEKSVGWVSMRSGLIGEMKSQVAERIMRGEFPAYAYMYSLRHFMRMNKVQADEIAEFVSATAGHGFSVRDIEVLANGFFRGGEEIRQEILAGKVDWCLKTLKAVECAAGTCTAEEQRTLTDLELLSRKMKRLSVTVQTDSQMTGGFLAQAHILCGGILRVINPFTEKVRGLHDRSRSPQEHCNPP